jgi:hypothetical protein
VAMQLVITTSIASPSPASRPGRGVHPVSNLDGSESESERGVRY